jgi:hypothetical protein
MVDCNICDLVLDVGGLTEACCGCACRKTSEFDAMADRQNTRRARDEQRGAGEEKKEDEVKNLKEQLAAMKKRAEEEKKRAEEETRQRVEAVKRATTETKRAEEEARQRVEVEKRAVEEQTKNVDLRVFGTRSELYCLPTGNDSFGGCSCRGSNHYGHGPVPFWQAHYRG